MAQVIYDKRHHRLERLRIVFRPKGEDTEERFDYEKAAIDALGKLTWLPCTREWVDYTNRRLVDLKLRELVVSPCIESDKQEVSD